MKYCGTCVLPDTRPNLIIQNDGTCNCAIGHQKIAVDWDRREVEFGKLCEYLKSKRAIYDCVIPVSGGKDSTWQVAKAIEYGLRPLCVTWRSPARTALGQENLDNLVSLGVDHFDVTISPKIERKFTRICFEEKGSPAIPMHFGIHALPLRTALRVGSPLILWGENSALEYGGDESLANGAELTSEWFAKYGVTGGTGIDEWARPGLSIRDLDAYRIPDPQVLRDAKIRASFLGYYFKWDPILTRDVACSLGFRSAAKAEVGWYDFADIDDAFIMAVHHWMKWFKFGFTRTWDNLSLEIRAGRLKRAEAIDIIKEIGFEEPVEAIDRFCSYVEMPRKQFDVVCEKYRNRNIWERDSSGRWIISKFLINDWGW